MNFRDLGGLRTKDGRRISKSRIFRSGRLTGFAPNDFSQITKLGIRSIFDLRSTNERLKHPGPDSDQWHGNYVGVAIDADIRAKTSLFSPLVENPTPSGARAVMSSIYRSFPETFSPHLRHFFDGLINGGTPLIIHCTAGKDRTGFVVAILLSALGILDDDVFDDYLLSSQVMSLKELYDEVSDLLTSRIGHPPSREVVETILGVDRQYLQASFDEIHRTCGSIGAYLQSSRIDHAQIVELQSLFLESR